MSNLQVFYSIMKCSILSVIICVILLDFVLQTQAKNKCKDECISIAETHQQYHGDVARKHMDIDECKAFFSDMDLCASSLDFVGTQTFVCIHKCRNNTSETAAVCIHLCKFRTSELTKAW